MPKDKCSYFTIRLISTKTGTIAVGFIDRKEQRERQSVYSLSYDFRTGDLKDSNFEKEAKQCNWHKFRDPIPLKKNSVVRVEVSPRDQRVAFYCDNEWACETVIPNYLMKVDMVPYISIKHQHDEFLINDE